MKAAENIGIGLQAFCIPGSVADDRKVGLGHGNLAARLLSEETQCFAFLAGHESFAAAEGAIKIAAKADKVRKEPLRVILNGLGKDAAQIISRIFRCVYGCSGIAGGIPSGICVHDVVKRVHRSEPSATGERMKMLIFNL